MSHDKTTAIDSPPVTEQLCEWATSLTLEDVPHEVQQRAKHLILDAIGCGLVGAHVPWSEDALNAMATFEAPGNCSLIGWSDKVCGLNPRLEWTQVLHPFPVEGANSVSNRHLVRSLLLCSMVHLSKLWSLMITTQRRRCIRGVSLCRRSWLQGALRVRNREATVYQTNQPRHPRGMQSPVKTSCWQP